jgi:hypothetical protein
MLPEDGCKKQPKYVGVVLYSWTGAVFGKKKLIYMYSSYFIIYLT